MSVALVSCSGSVLSLSPKPLHLLFSLKGDFVSLSLSLSVVPRRNSGTPYLRGWSTTRNHVSPLLVDDYCSIRSGGGSRKQRRSSLSMALRAQIDGSREMSNSHWTTEYVASQEH
ncbi:Uncharacterized protein Rs2_22295 [Raphanus sativus]|nr:Uncharacterized protein Rs2_22295 [Raphanus sativus]